MADLLLQNYKHLQTPHFISSISMVRFENVCGFFKIRSAKHTNYSLHSAPLIVKLFMQYITLSFTEQLWKGVEDMFAMD